MNTTTDPAITRLDGGQLAPVLTAADLTPGSIITGVAYNSVHVVIGIMYTTDAPEGRVHLQKLPQQAQPPDHVHRFDRHADRSGCACGFTRKPVNDLLPSDNNTPRTYRIDRMDPRATLDTPDPFTLYIISGALPQIVRAVAGQWFVAGSLTQLPIVTKLQPIWSVPPALRVLLTDTDRTNRQ